MPSATACSLLVLIHANTAAQTIHPHSNSLSDEIIDRPLMPCSPMTLRAASIAERVAFAAHSASISRSLWTAPTMSGCPGGLLDTSRRPFGHCRRGNTDRCERGGSLALDLLHLDPRLAIGRHRGLKAVLVLEVAALLGLLDADLGNEAKPVEIAPGVHAAPSLGGVALVVGADAAGAFEDAAQPGRRDVGGLLVSFRGAFQGEQAPELA